jgi:hypothetical protein
VTVRGTRLAALVTVVGVVATGCTNRSEPPPPTVLRVAVTDLPAGVRGDVHVTGEGLDRRVSATTDLRDVAPGEYTLAIEPVRTTDDATAHPVTARIPVRVPEHTTTVATARYGIVVPDTTRVLDAAATGLVADVAGPVLVFDGEAPLVSSFEPGQVLVSGVGPRTPEGLLRKVVEVRRGARGVEVRTEPATLTDAVPVGELTLREHGFGDATLPNLRRAQTGTVQVGFELSQGGAAAGSPCGTALTGDLGLSWGPSIDLDWKWAKVVGVPLRVDRAKFVVDAEHLLSFTWANAVSASCSVEIVKPRIPHVVGVYTLPLGPVPVVVSLTVQAVGKADVSGAVSATRELGVGAKLALGVEYRRGKVKPIVELGKPEANDGVDVTASLDASARVGLRGGLRFYGVTGPYLDLTVGVRAGADSGGTIAGCAGFYGDMGWDMPGVSIEKKDIIALERQVLPHFLDRCPLAEPPPEDRKAVPHRGKPTLDDYRWMIGTWERHTDERDAPGERLREETLVITEDGHVSITYQNNIPLGREEPLRCSGVLAFTTEGILVIDTSDGPPGYLSGCHTSLDDHDITYVPAADGEPEHLDWFSVAEQPLLRVH